MAEDKPIEDSDDTEIGYVKEREITEEMEESYIDYAMSVIISRALPDVRDGLKPVQRRILYAMDQLGLKAGGSFKKSATVVGRVIGRFHPHGDQSIYDSMVRMAQDFSLRYPLVNGQGNFGCFTGDTKVRLTDGRNLSFEELVKEDKGGKDNYTFSFNSETERIEITKIKNPRLTRKNEEIMKVTLDNGEEIRCTLDHRFMLRVGSYKEAQNLEPGDSLMPLYVKKSAPIQIKSAHNQSRVLNHKVARIEFLGEREDVYDITTEPSHNFALDAGIFVHNSLDGDEAAAYRYTESKMSHPGEEMLEDINKDTVDFKDNFDGSTQEPKVLPSPLPQLLLNGCLGIAVGMATKIPPHNLTEVVDASLHLLDNPDATTEDLFEFIQGPDFPTGGVVYNREQMISAYSKGKGSIVMRGSAEIKEGKGRSKIIINEIPYNLKKSSLIEKIADLVKDDELEGVKGIRDESSKEGVRIVIPLKQGSYPKQVLSQLYKFTRLQKTFHLNAVALVDGIQPQLLSLPEILNKFLEHRQEVVLRRTKYLLNKAENRAHILEGLHKALADIDQAIQTIKEAKHKTEAKKELREQFDLTVKQAEAVLNIKLQRLSKMEREKIADELEQKKEEIEEYEKIIGDQEEVKKIVKKELRKVKKEYGDERRTRVVEGEVGEIEKKDLVPSKDTLITLTEQGYIKRVNPKSYKVQNRGGKGIIGMETSEDDQVKHFVLANTLDDLLFFTTTGKVFKIPAHRIPSGSRQAKGRGISNFLNISTDESILSILPLEEDTDNEFLIMATENGIINKSPLSDFDNIRKNGIRALKLKEDDQLVEVDKSSGSDQIMMVTREGKAIRFKEDEVRATGRPSAGVKGVSLDDDQVIGMEVVRGKISNKQLLVLTENGFGKRTEVSDYRLQSRGGKGIKTASFTDQTGSLREAKVVKESEGMIIISNQGQVMRIKVDSVPTQGRNTQGVKIMDLKQGDQVASVAVI